MNRRSKPKNESGSLNRKSKAKSRLLRKSKKAERQNSSVTLSEADPKFEGKRKVWVGSNPSQVYELGFVDGESLAKRKRVIVETLSGRKVPTKQVMLANDTIVENISNLLYINEAAILHNVESRALKDECYTFMGPVLLAVNPLKEIPFPFSAGDNSIPTSLPHPYSLAEAVISQMGFHNRMSQSIVISGESGAGKTVAAKQVLQHVVKRCFISDYDSTQKEYLDDRMLATNPLLEAFGNASTLRNANSSRFGKFLKLFFEEQQLIYGGALVTYLLERSRVTVHSPGERNYHVFYQMLAGGSKEQKQRWGLSDKHKFRYLLPIGSDDKESIRTLPTDESDFAQLCQALTYVHIKNGEQQLLFDLLAGILHLGDVPILEGGRNGDATVRTSDVEHAATLLGIDPNVLAGLFCERSITVGSEVTRVPLAVDQAFKARDGIAKEIYGRLFRWIEGRINDCLVESKTTPNTFIGVLDIFGFESFEYNGLQQLLINYANEQLQQSFDMHVLQSESVEYMQEGLTLGNKPMTKRDLAISRSSVRSMASSRTGRGNTVLRTASGDLVQDLLTLVDHEAQKLKPSDANICKDIHSRYSHSRGFKPVHASKRAACFTIVHFAGAVTYTVGKFLETNDDSLPHDTTDVFLKSKNDVIQDILTQIHSTGSPTSSPRSSERKHGSRGNKSLVKTSISKKFVCQMEELVETLDSTQCSYIRCIKPNPLMFREPVQVKKEGKEGKEGKKWKRHWFDRRYVCSQLKSLGITAAAATFRDGLPIKLDYPEIMAIFELVLRGEVEKCFLSHGESQPHRFVVALLHALEVPSDKYKLGYSKVFFDTSVINILEGKMKEVDRWVNKDENPARYDKFIVDVKSYLVRNRWKRAFNAVRAYNIMLETKAKCRDHRLAVRVIQKSIRMMLAQRHYQKYRAAALCGQRLYRGGVGRTLALERIDEAQRLAREKRQRDKLLAEQAKKEMTDKKKKKKKVKKKKSDEKKVEDGAKPQLSPTSSAEEPKNFSRVRKKSMAPIHFDEETFDKALSNVEKDNAKREKNVELSYTDKRTSASSSLMDRSLETDSLVDQEWTSESSDSESSAMDFDEAESIKVTRKQKRAIRQEQSLEPLTGVAKMLGIIKAKSTWKKRYFVFNPEDSTISFFQCKNDGPKGNVLGVFQINPPDYMPPPKVETSLNDSVTIKSGGLLSSKPGNYALRVVGGKLDTDILQENRTVTMCFETVEVFREWEKALQRAVTMSYTASIDDSTSEDADSVGTYGNFGQQVICPKKFCKTLNNTLYGKTCRVCGEYLLT